MSWHKLPREFFDRPTLRVARDLLGLYLVYDTPQGRRAGRIVETEAYIGPEDRASHASRGLTPRTRIMFGPPGFAYVYLVYGMHYCFNIVTERAGYPAAVLIRALEPAEGIPRGVSTSGPGRLCRALGITRQHNGLDLTCGPLYLEDRGERVMAEDIVQAPRVGVAYAGEWAARPWRFYARSSRWVSVRGSAPDSPEEEASPSSSVAADSSGAPSAR